MNRYNRHIILSEIGLEGQHKINMAKVLVVGAGGLGCPVLQYLAAAGIGTLGIIDFDIVSESNLQRQVLFGSSSLGINKAIAAKKRLEDLNTSITIHAYPKKLNYKNAISFFKEYDIIVDGTDNFKTRYLVSDACIITKKPLVYAGIYKFEGQVSVFNYNNGPSYRCLFPTPPRAEEIPNCSEIGVLGVLTGIIGSFQANEVIKIILNLGKILSGKVLYYNSLSHLFKLIKVSRSEKEIQKAIDSKPYFESLGEDLNYDVLSKLITIKEAITRKNTQWVDVRNKNKNPTINHPKILQIPFNNLENNVDKLDANKEQIIFCQTGITSKKAISILQKNHFKDSFSLKNGALEVMNHFKKNNYEKP